MKDKIVGILNDSDKALTIYDLEDKLHLLDVDELQELQTCLSELEKDAVIYHSNKDKYMMLEDSHLKRGIMRANKKGFGFVDIDDSDVDVYISEEHMNGALHDDIVLVEIIFCFTRSIFCLIGYFINDIKIILYISIVLIFIISFIKRKEVKDVS